MTEFKLIYSIDEAYNYHIPAVQLNKYSSFQKKSEFSSKNGFCWRKLLQTFGRECTSGFVVRGDQKWRLERDGFRGTKLLASNVRNARRINRIRAGLIIRVPPSSLSLFLFLNTNQFRPRAISVDPINLSHTRVIPG